MTYGKYLKGSGGQPEGSEGQPKGSEGQPEGYKGQSKGYDRQKGILAHIVWLKADAINVQSTTNA